MDKNEWTGILIILGIIGLALFGGAMKTKNFSIVPKNNQVNGVTVVDNNNPKTQRQIQADITKAQREVKELEKKVVAEQQKKLQSKYYGLIKISSISRSTDPNREYVLLRVGSGVTETIPVTGWTIKSTVSGQSVTIPKASLLYFTGMENVEENIVLDKNDSLYLVTGISPNGASFRLNKCSGYLSQFQTFYPSISSSCPRPRDEDLSSIPQTLNNDACLDYIKSFPSCRIQTKSPPANWSYECTRFIYDKINYPSCVNVHKNDTDFYKDEWRVYLKRSERLWKSDKESVILYDNEGKIVSTYSY
ncbi:MAG TPA: hypothetical protein VGC58_00245 [Candidatus Paceibacterota bacterium]